MAQVQPKGNYKCYACFEMLYISVALKLDARYTCPKCGTRDRVRSLLRPR